MNITVEDIDDNGPSFENADKTTCVIPVYSAGASEEFVVCIFDYTRLLILIHAKIGLNLSCLHTKFVNL